MATVEGHSKMLLLKVIIETSGAAFEGQALGTELARILRTITNDPATDVRIGPLFDINGNQVGLVKTEDE